MSDAPPTYLALDLWMALGGSDSDFNGYYQRNGWAATWATLLHAVRVARGESRCGEYDDDIEGPCVLLEHSDTSPHYGADDVGRIETLPFIVKSSDA